MHEQSRPILSARERQFAERRSAVLSFGLKHGVGVAATSQRSQATRRAAGGASFKTAIVQ